MNDDAEAIAELIQLTKEKNQEDLNTNIAERINAVDQIIENNEQNIINESLPPNEDQMKSKNETEKESEINQSVDNESISKAKAEINKEIGNIRGLEENDRKKEIKKMYLKWHPDKNQGKEKNFTEAFKHLMEKIEENVRNPSLNQGPENQGSKEQNSEDQEDEENNEYHNYYFFDAFLFHLAKKYRHNKSKKIIKPTRIYRSKKSIQENCYNCYFIDDESLKEGEDEHFCLFIDDTYDDYKVKDVGMNLKSYLVFDEKKSNAFVEELKKKILQKKIEVIYEKSAKGNKVEFLKLID